MCCCDRKWFPFLSRGTPSKWWERASILASLVAGPTGDPAPFERARGKRGEPINRGPSEGGRNVCVSGGCSGLFRVHASVDKGKAAVILPKLQEISTEAYVGFFFSEAQFPSCLHQISSLPWLSVFFSTHGQCRGWSIIHINGPPIVCCSSFPFPSQEPAKQGIMCSWALNKCLMMIIRSWAICYHNIYFSHFA